LAQRRDELGRKLEKASQEAAGPLNALVDQAVRNGSAHPVKEGRAYLPPAASAAFSGSRTPST
jgi:hypothetical protein